MDAQDMDAQKVWIVGLHDYGDNGWGIVGVFATREQAVAFIDDNPTTFGYYEIEDSEDADEGWTIR